MTGTARPTVALLAPSPILTVTIEHGPGDPEVHLHAGGQGYWVARMLVAMDVQVSFCAPLGGEIGDVLEPLLERAGLDLLATATTGWNGAYVHERRGDEVVTIAETPSPRLERHEADDLYTAMVTASLGADLAVVTGTRGDGVLEADLYRRLCADLHANGCRVAADLSGPVLTAALAGGITFLHLNEREMRERSGGSLASEAEILVAARDLQAEGALNLVLSRGAAPALALLGGEAVEVAGPAFSAREPRGAGDSMFAAIAAGLAAGIDERAAIRRGAAAGALNALRRGLGSGSRAQIEQLAGQVELRPWPSGRAPT